MKTCCQRPHEPYVHVSTEPRFTSGSGPRLGSVCSVGKGERANIDRMSKSYSLLVAVSTTALFFFYYCTEIQMKAKTANLPGYMLLIYLGIWVPISRIVVFRGLAYTHTHADTSTDMHIDIYWVHLDIQGQKLSLYMRQSM